MIEITPDIRLDEAELQFSFIRASGPGGQNVNKVATAVQLRFDAAGSRTLPDPLRERLLRQAGKRATASGEIVIEAKRFRSQLRNREDAVERLVAMIRRAAIPPKARRKTRISAAAKTRVLQDKRQRAQVKQRRRPVRGDAD